MADGIPVAANDESRRARPGGAGAAREGSSVDGVLKSGEVIVGGDLNADGAPPGPCNALPGAG